MVWANLPDSTNGYYVKSFHQRIRPVRYLGVSSCYGVAYHKPRLFSRFRELRTLRSSLYVREGFFFFFS